MVCGPVCFPFMVPVERTRVETGCLWENSSGKLQMPCDDHFCCCCSGANEFCCSFNKGYASCYTVHWTGTLLNFLLKIEHFCELFQVVCLLVFRILMFVRNGSQIKNLAFFYVYMHAHMCLCVLIKLTETLEMPDKSDLSSFSLLHLPFNAEFGCILNHIPHGFFPLLIGVHQWRSRFGF